MTTLQVGSNQDHAASRTHHIPGAEVHDGLILSSSREALLAALVGFIQPLVHACGVSAGTPEPDQYLARNGDHASLKRHGSEGQELLESLERFTETTIRRQSQKQNKSEDKEEKQTNEFVVDSQIAVTPGRVKIPEPPAGIDPVASAFLEKIQGHVYNEMPIRMLAFDRDGENLRLVERHELIPLVLSSALKVFEGTHDSSTSDDLISTAVRKAADYAILSHEWIRGDGPGDIVYDEWRTPRAAFKKEGRSKIVNFCRVSAQDHGIMLGWIDTVCINKESSSELDESIRSMYKWYRNAAVCVTYLSQTQDLESMHKDSWFTRGWTLQELLAPWKTMFYTKNWTQLIDEGRTKSHLWSTRSHRTSDEPTAIDKQIQKATTLTFDELQYCQYGVLSLSRIMQLAANRNVTRTEDQVYSLMGLLGVEITIAYGEGSERALLRLMREVLTTRHNLLDVFNHSYSGTSESQQSALVPSSISAYRDRLTMFDRTAKSLITSSRWKPLEPMILTHLGVRISFLLIPAKLKRGNHDYQDYKPRGCISGIVEGTFQLQKDLIKVWFSGSERPGSKPDRLYLLDECLYTPLKAHRERRSIVTLGVYNFKVRNNHLYLPVACVSIPLACHGKVNDVDPSDRIEVIPQPHPFVFQVQYNGAIPDMYGHQAADSGLDIAKRHEEKLPISPSTGKHIAKIKDLGEGGHRISLDELERHGMQLITLYL